MKTKNCNGTSKTTKKNCGTKNCKGAKGSKSGSSESDSDPQGSYTGNPIGWGKYAEPVQDADDL